VRHSQEADAPARESAAPIARGVGRTTTAADALLRLQRGAGNRAVARLVAERSLARDKTKVPDPTQGGRVKAGEAAPTLASAIETRAGDKSYPEDRIGQLRATVFVAQLRKLMGDAKLVKAEADRIKAEQEKFWGRVKSPEKAAEHIPQAADIQQVVDALVKILDAAATPADQTFTAIDLKANTAFAGSKPRLALAQALMQAASAGHEAAAVKQRAAELSARPEGTEFGTKLSSTQRKEWSKALRKLPAVQDLAGMHKAKASTPAARANADAQWKAGAGLVDAAVRTDAQGRNPSKLPAADPMHAKIVAADAIIRRMVEASVLGRLAPPVVHIHPQNDDVFRAHQSGTEVHLAANEPVWIIVHETGHYLESLGDKGNWVDIQRLLHQRHEAAGGGTAVAGSGNDKAEGRYRGDYKATGKYTSSIYKDGSTEVMAMSVEYLANPKRFATLLDDDPLQAAIVIRALQPAAYAAEPDLAKFNTFMPS
jgi:hypothetical protein